MTISIQGISVSRGIAIGKAHCIKRDQIDTPQYIISRTDVNKEISRLINAIKNARKELKAIRDNIPSKTSINISEFINTHLLMLEDSALTEEPKKIIQDRLYNAEWALKLQRDALVNVFDEMADAYLSTRKDDVDHVVNRILRILLKQKPLLDELPDEHLKNKIIVADDLTPADTVLMQHYEIAAFATEFGGSTSHTAILARNLRIPAVVGLHNAKKLIKNDDVAILDGSSGIILINPDKNILNHYQKKQTEVKKYYASLNKFKDAPAKSIDGIPITLMANIELPEDFETVRDVGAAGVGLYRTEFLYMNRNSPPDEEEHFETYMEVIKALQGLPLTIRTVDLGADKEVDGVGRQSSHIRSNPALGLRAVRLCLKEPEFFRPQLRAIIRASAHGPIRIMIPMLTNTQEMQQILFIVDELKTELENKSISFDKEIKIGGMIEVPASAICADIFADKLDFLSIGTNDLIQYLMAVDRMDDRVSHLYQPTHPAVLRSLKGIFEQSDSNQKHVSVCGEMAGEPIYAALLIGLGAKSLSVSVSRLPEIKHYIRLMNLGELKELINELMTLDQADPIEQKLKAFIEKL